MFKSIAISLWLMGLLSTSVFYFATRPVEPNSGGAAEQVSYEYVALQPVTVAMVRNEEIRGYLILELSVALVGSEMKNMQAPIEYVMRDRVIASLHANKKLDILKLSEFDVDELSKDLKADINASLGVEAVASVLVQNMNFVSKEDIRDTLLRRS